MKTIAAEPRTLEAGPGSWTAHDAAYSPFRQFVVRYEGYRRIYPPREHVAHEAEYDFFR